MDGRGVASPLAPLSCLLGTLQPQDGGALWEGQLQGQCKGPSVQSLCLSLLHLGHKSQASNGGEKMEVYSQFKVFLRAEMFVPTMFPCGLTGLHLIKQAEKEIYGMKLQACRICELSCPHVYEMLLSWAVL